MNNSAEVLGGIAVLAFAALAAFAVYSWLQKNRIRRVEKWVRDYLRVRYGELPNHLNINCSNDTLWPVLVEFDGPRIGITKRLRFSCVGQPSTFSLVSEKEETR